MPQTLFTNVQVLDGSGSEPFPGQVLVQGNRIKAVAPASETVAHDNAEVIDGGGATLMPGLVESHAHPSFANTSDLHSLGDIPPEEHTLVTIRHVKLLLDHGFTSINSAAAAKPRMDIVARNAINAGEFPGPRMLAASPELTVTSGLGDVRLSHLHRETFAIVCDGPTEFRRVAREMCREGVDTLKINPSGDELVPYAKAQQTVMMEDEIQAVCEVGLAHGKRIATHARSAKSVKLSLKHGCEVIYHATFADEEALDMLEEAKDRVFVSPTIGVTYTTLYEAGDWGITPDIGEQLGLKRELEHAIPVVASLRKRGVRVLPGGDYGFAWNPVGANARDLEHFVELFGYTPLEAIQSATKMGGEIMMMGDELGTITEGYLADILLVDGDPSKDVSLLQDRNRLLAIMKDGAFHKAPPASMAAAQIAAE